MSPNKFLSILVILFLLSSCSQIDDSKEIGWSDLIPFTSIFNPSDVKFNKKDNSIKVTNIGGPLNHLENVWHFKEQGNATEIFFDIDFEIENKFLNIVMTKSFQFGLDKIADAFQKRAEELFGNSKN